MKGNWLLAFLLLCGGTALANVRLPSVLADGMVVQQKSSVKLWGWCDPGEKIFIRPSWGQAVDSAVGTRDGRWIVAVATPAAGGPFTIEIKGWNTITLNNVLTGEVWVCSGQSNMEMCETWGLPDVKAELPTCANSRIRFFHVPRTTSATVQDDCPGSWAACDSNQLKWFSAVGYFFGKRLNQELDVPVGLIEASWGGTNAEDWTPAELVTDDPVLKAAEDRQVPQNGWPYLPGYCYNAMIAPLTQFRIAGALWYQGESNVGTADSYAKLLTTMIGAWRKAWNSPLPFYYVQIAPFTYGTKDQAAFLREQEAAVQDIGGTGMVVVSDLVSDTTDIHPKDKHDVGLRLANWALAETYGRRGLTYKNPRFSTMEVNGDQVTLSFSDAPAGLTVKGPVIKTLVVAGDDRVFYPAEGKVVGNKLVVWAKEVKKPVAVRYQFSNAGIGNIAGKDGLPLAPFRTDKW
ncbi:MAG TPA: sialate O-acetylesterase [Puia sp.]|nr:sialate O-acetylesterase [Puia sp.]